MQADEQLAVRELPGEQVRGAAAAALFASLRTDKTTGHNDPDVRAPGEMAVPENG